MYTAAVAVAAAAVAECYVKRLFSQQLTEPPPLFALVIKDDRVGVRGPGTLCAHSCGGK